MKPKFTNYLKYSLFLINIIGIISSARGVQGYSSLTFGINTLTGKFFITNDACLLILFILSLTFLSFLASFINFKNPKIMIIFSLIAIILLLVSNSNGLVRACILE